MKKRVNAVVSKLTGISTSFFGISWQPSTPETEVVKKLLMYFESKRSLGVDELGRDGHCAPVRPDWLSMSVIQVRDQTVLTMQTMALSKGADNVMNIIVSRCNHFLCELESDEKAHSYETLLHHWHREMASCIYSLCRNVKVYPGTRLCLLLEWRLPSNVKLSDLEQFI